MNARAMLAAFCLLLLIQPAWAVDHRVEALAEPVPSDAVSAEIAKQLNPSGVRVLRGESRTVVDLWLAKQWKVKPDFEATSTVLYPFEVGSLIGVARFKNRGSDFRNQEIPAGVYTIRYGQQPVDGNHVGTSDTLDFLLLIPAKEDTKAGPLTPQQLAQLSPKTTGTTHPAILSLLRAGEVAKAPAMRHDEERDLWSVVVKGQGQAGEKSAPLPVAIVVAGHAPE